MTGSCAVFTCVGQLNIHTQFNPFGEDFFSRIETLVSEQLIAFSIKEDLCWDHRDTVNLSGAGVLPYIDKNHIELPGKILA